MKPDVECKDVSKRVAFRAFANLIHSFDGLDLRIAHVIIRNTMRNKRFVFQHLPEPNRASGRCFVVT